MIANRLSIPLTPLKSHLGFVIPLALFFFLIYACGEDGGTEVSRAGNRVSQGGPVTDTLSLIDNLRAEGAAVVPTRTIAQPFFVPKGQEIEVNGEAIQVFEFDNSESADAVSDTISPDGATVGSTQVGWAAPVHFYKAGRLIVIYTGNHAEVVFLLEGVLGPRFAGTQGP